MSRIAPLASQPEGAAVSTVKAAAIGKPNRPQSQTEFSRPQTREIGVPNRPLQTQDTASDAQGLSSISRAS